eukprot:scaffold6084_cov112-Isochrysis_galbana.AAC.2
MLSAQLPRHNPARTLPIHGRDRQNQLVPLPNAEDEAGARRCGGQSRRHEARDEHSQWHSHRRTLPRRLRNRLNVARRPIVGCGRRRAGWRGIRLPEPRDLRQGALDPVVMHGHEAHVLQH